MVDLGPLHYQPKPGDIGLTQIPDWGGRVIRALQWVNGCGYADYEHAFMVTAFEPGTDDVGTIVEAMPGGAQEVRNWHDPARTRWLICPDEYREAVTAIAHRCAARRVPYAWSDYAALGLHRFHVPFPLLKRYIESSGHMICSQLVDWCANKGGWHLFDDDRWEGYVPPCDLNRLWRSLPADRRAGR